MSGDDGSTTSIWTATARVPEFAPLRANRKVDVCIVGAGITGLTCAYELLCRGVKKVVVLDDKPVGGGESSRTTAHLSYALDEGFDALEKIHGSDGARLAAASHRQAVDRIESIVKAERIACGFERLDGYLFADLDQDQGQLEKEIAAAHRAGLTDVHWATRRPVATVGPERCIVFPGQGQFHILEYLAGLAQAVEREGGKIYTGTHVSGVEGGAPARVQTASGRQVEAGSVIVATNSPISDRMALHTKIYPYRTYAIGLQVPADPSSSALWWDMAEPYHYVRRQRSNGVEAGKPGHDLLIVGGEDHKVGQDDTAPHTRFGRLESWARERFVGLGPVEYRWSGQVVEPVDGLAYIGRDPAGHENVYIATGDSGHGMTHGTLAGELLASLILDGDHAWASLYEPSRKSLRTAGTFLVENLNVARQLADWVTPGEVSSPDQIVPGAGAVIREGTAKVAISRDADGTYTRLSAVCPHLGCIVRWNAVEHSWDCPCHGSRFAADGRVLSGPSPKPLPAAE